MALEHRIVHRDGSVRWVRNTSVPHYDERRRLVAYDSLISNITECKRAEEALREGEQRLHSIIDGSPIPAFVIGKDHRVIHWNKALEEMSRIKSEEVVGTCTHWRGFYNEERPCMADLLVDEAVELVPQWYSGKYIKSPLIEDAYEATDFFPALGEDGKYLRFTAAAIRDSKGVIVAAFETLEDITERKIAEEALQESHRRLNDIIDFLPDATFVVDADGKVIAWNKAIEKLTGVSTEEMLGKDNYEYAIPFYRERRLILIDLAFLPDEEFEMRKYDAVYRIADTLYGEVYVPKTYEGKGAYLSATASRLRNTTGNVIGAIESLRDITDRKRMEEALRESEEKYRTLSHNIPDIIYSLDKIGNVLAVNEPAISRYGYDAEMVVGKPFLDIIHPDDKEMVANSFLQAMKDHREYTKGLQFRVQSKDGAVRLVELNSHTRFDEQGRYFQEEGVLRDITERKRAEEEKRILEERLQHADKMEAVGTLAGGIAHDFNNLLMGIQGYASLTLMDLDPSHPHYERLKRIEEQVQSGADLTRQLLGFASGGRYEVKPADMN
ncbi:MAG: PAS domain S-box protein, partial [Deltaproteobacteria bacterium]|nr:PAS domain S-box protein [Deltaproteobacteria bacterium]